MVETYNGETGYKTITKMMEKPLEGTTLLTISRDKVCRRLDDHTVYKEDCYYKF